MVEITDRFNGVRDGAHARPASISRNQIGGVPLNRAFAEAARNDRETLAPGVFVIITVMAAVPPRSPPATVAIVAVIMFVIDTMAGLACRIGTVFNPASAGVPTVVMTVAVATLSTSPQQLSWA